MKIRIISLCFLLLVSIALSAQDPSRKRAKEKEEAVQVDKRENAKKAVEMSAREATKLADQIPKLKKNNWQTIPKLIVPPGRTFQLKSNLLQIDTLIMLPNSGLALMQGNNVMIIGHANIAPGARIIGRGKNGVDGQDGINGDPSAQMPGARDGSHGSNGTNGANAPDLKLYLGGINSTGNLSIVLTGGVGGKGGNGGDGGTKKTDCGNKKGVEGTNGGNAGQGGNGGRQGEFILVVKEGVNRKAVTFKSIEGKPGTNGLGGLAGWVKEKCSFLSKRKSRPGDPGIGHTNHAIQGAPKTNPDFLVFPSPVPKPSASTTVPINVPEGSTYGTVDTKLRSALRACGYNNLNYRKYKDGFAIFTGMEHITGEGVPLSEPDRFSPEQVKFYNDPSFLSYLASLFQANTGYSRIIVFIVTAEGIGTKPGGVARSEAIEWFESGVEDLPSAIRKRPFTEQHILKALIYEFSKRENGSDPVFSEPSLIGADQHLIGASLWPFLIAE